MTTHFIWAYGGKRTACGRMFNDKRMFMTGHVALVDCLRCMTTLKYQEAKKSCRNQPSKSSSPKSTSDATSCPETNPSTSTTAASASTSAPAAAGIFTSATGTAHPPLYPDPGLMVSMNRVSNQQIRNRLWLWP